MNRMFFVGATGQLLTLILTVCLPFVFFISATPDVQIAQETAIINPIGIYTDFVSFEVRTEHIQTENNFEVQEIIFYPKSYSSVNFPPGSKQSCQSIYQTSSGNKAPPSLLCFS